MAYITQEKKKAVQQAVKAILPKGWKVSFKVKDHAVLVATVRQAPKEEFFDMLYENTQEQNKNNYYHFPVVHPINKETLVAENLVVNLNIGTNAKFFKETNRSYFKTDSKGFELLLKIAEIMCEGNWDKSDSLADYYDVGWYSELKLGEWDKPLALI